MSAPKRPASPPDPVTSTLITGDGREDEVRDDAAESVEVDVGPDDGATAFLRAPASPGGRRRGAWPREGGPPGRGGDGEGPRHRGGVGPPRAGAAPRARGPSGRLARRPRVLARAARPEADPPRRTGRAGGGAVSP